MALPKPVSRADMYLSYLNYTKGLTLANLPKPVSRADMYLYNLCINRGIGGGSGGSNVTLNGEPQTNFNFIGDENSTINALQIGEKTYSFNGSGSGGTNTDNVVDRVGRTQEQINRTFYKRACKEIPSPNGDPITVENGEEGYVLSAEIKGQTVKNLLQNFTKTTPSDDTINGQYRTPMDVPPLSTITIIAKISNIDTTNGSVLSPAFLTKIDDGSKVLYFDGGKDITSKIKNGIFINTVTLLENDKYLNSSTRIYKPPVSTANCTIEWLVVLEGTHTSVNDYISFGLNSTEAIISNNGESYPIYATEEDKANKKVISLRGTSETKDTLEIKEDGSGVWTRNLGTQAIKYSDNWQTYDKYADGYKTYKVKQKEQIMNVNSICICDKLPHQKWITAIYPTPALAGEYITVQGDTFVISVKEETAPTLDDFKNYLKQIGDIIITYPTKTPTTTDIQKELMPTILTQQTNILEVGGAVKPSSFKVTLPVDKLAEIEARLQALESTTVDVVLNK